jgi:hypothetical protein
MPGEKYAKISLEIVVDAKNSDAAWDWLVEARNRIQDEIGIRSEVFTRKLTDQERITIN